MSQTSSRKVPHVGPLDATYFFIGEFPCTADDAAQLPMQGSAGELFWASLDEVGISRDDVRVGNLLNYQPYKNKYDLAKGSWQFSEGRNELLAYLKSHKHKVLVPLGDAPLEFLTGYNSITKHRGSVYEYIHTPIMGTFSSSTVHTDGGNTPAFLHDLLKLQRIASGSFQYPTFNFYVDPTAQTLADLLPKLLQEKRLWVDIETRRVTGELKCIGFAWNTQDAVCIFRDSPMWEIFVRTLLESDVPKTFHNGYFDTMLLRQWGYSVNAWDYDTMIAQHCIQPELPLGLDFCASLYTDMNYWKDDGKDSSDRVPRERLGKYNCMDCVATAGVQLGQEEELDAVTRDLFQYEFSQVPLAQHFTESGMLVDEERRTELKQLVETRTLDDAKSFRILQMMSGVTDYFTVSQHAKLQQFLYKTLALPTKTDSEGKITSGEDAIISLITQVEREIQSRKTPAAREPWENKLIALKLILRIRGYDKLLGSYINVTQSPDGRVRASYSLTGTESGRWSSSKHWDGTGLNAQTIPRESV